jgi:hypothetical protein
MTRNSFQPGSGLINATGRTAAALILLTIAPSSAGAQQGPRFDIHGYVAPRCWVAKPAPVQAFGAQGQAICNQARPALQSHIHMLNPDLEVRPVSNGQPTPMAWEITVSPQL